MRLDLWEFVLHVIRVHRLNLFAGGGAKNLDDLNKLINAAFAGEEGLAQHKLGHDTARGPYVNVGGIIGCPEYQLRRAVITRADIADVGFARNQNLGGPEVA